MSEETREEADTRVAAAKKEIEDRRAMCRKGETYQEWTRFQGIGIGDVPVKEPYTFCGFETVDKCTIESWPDRRIRFHAATPEECENLLFAYMKDQP